MTELSLSTGPRRSREQRELDLASISRWVLEGKSQSEIIDLLEQRHGFRLSAQTISVDVAELKKRWQVRAFEDYSTHLGMVLEKLDMLEDSLWRGYERSLQDRTTLLQEKRADTFGSNGAGSYSKKMAKRKKETSYGDLRYLQEIHEIQKTRAKLLGLNSPARVELDWRVQARLESGLSDAKLNQMHEGLIGVFMDELKKMDELTGKK